MRKYIRDQKERDQKEDDDSFQKTLTLADFEAAPHYQSSGSTGAL